MRLDHLSFAAGPDGLASTAQRIGGLLGTDFIDGGVHPRFGTRNMTLPLAGGTYFEVVEVLDHPASDKAPFGQRQGHVAGAEARVDATIDEVGAEQPPDALGGAGKSIRSGGEADVVQAHAEILSLFAVGSDTGVVLS